MADGLHLMLKLVREERERAKAAGVGRGESAWSAASLLEAVATALPAVAEAAPVSSCAADRNL